LVPPLPAPFPVGSSAVPVEVVSVVTGAPAAGTSSTSAPSRRTTIGAAVFDAAPEPVPRSESPDP